MVLATEVGTRHGQWLPLTWHTWCLANDVALTALHNAKRDRTVIRVEQLADTLAALLDVPVQVLTGVRVGLAR